MSAPITLTLEMLAETYLYLLRLHRAYPGKSLGNDAMLAKMLDEIASAMGTDPEYVQNSFELVADAMKGDALK